MDFTDSQVERYSRHIILQDVGVEGQLKISQGKVPIVDAGSLGTSVALNLAAAGVGELLTNRMLIFDATTMVFRNVSFKRNKKCPVCGENPTITRLQEFELPACDIK